MRSPPGWLRLARQLQTIYEEHAATQRRSTNSVWIELEQRFDRLRTLRRQIDRAEAHGWRLAAHRLSQRLTATLRAVEVVLADARENAEGAPPPVPSIHDLLAELSQLEDEFGELTIDAKKRFLAVETPPIVLEDMDLGVFSLRLLWPRLAHDPGTGCFEIIARDDGRAAAANSAVTHPHVRDRRLCAGDAETPLRRALVEGRLADAFLVVRSVLEEYNPHSAFVALNDWQGVSCDSCGQRLSPDDCRVCDRCGRDTCEDCISSCLCCDRNECDTCQVHCGVCEAH